MYLFHEGFLKNWRNLAAFDLQRDPALSFPAGFKIEREGGLRHTQRGAWGVATSIKMSRTRPERPPLLLKTGAALACVRRCPPLRNQNRVETLNLSWFLKRMRFARPLRQIFFIPAAYGYGSTCLIFHRNLYELKFDAAVGRCEKKLILHRC